MHEPYFATYVPLTCQATHLLTPTSSSSSFVSMPFARPSVYTIRYIISLMQKGSKTIYYGMLRYDGSRTRADIGRFEYITRLPHQIVILYCCFLSKLASLEIIRHDFYVISK